MAGDDHSAGAPDGATRVCRKCGETKLLIEFPKARGCAEGRRLNCRPCQNAINLKRKYEVRSEGLDARRARTVAEAAAAHAASLASLAALGIRVCTKCGVERPLSDFPLRKRKNGRTAPHTQCRLCADAYVRAWMGRNPERAAAIAERRRPKQKLADRAYRLANLEKRNAGVARWKAANPERAAELSRVGAHNYRARALAAPGRFTADDVAAIRALQKDRCATCRVALRGRGERDHIVALTKGGTNERRNIQLLCTPCNRRKQAKDPIDFMRERGFLL